MGKGSAIGSGAIRRRPGAESIETEIAHFGDRCPPLKREAWVQPHRLIRLHPARRDAHAVLHGHTRAPGADLGSVERKQQIEKIVALLG